MKKIVVIKKATTHAKPQGICLVYVDDFPATSKSPHGHGRRGQTREQTDGRRRQADAGQGGSTQHTLATPSRSARRPTTVSPWKGPVVLRARRAHRDVGRMLIRKGPRRHDVRNGRTCGFPVTRCRRFLAGGKGRARKRSGPTCMAAALLSTAV